ncbi:MAG: hypothetical protein KAT15_12735 [Bacteroidales bacterium]|nr:hypothetical protein [Bacteroidales bacterium]
MRTEISTGDFRELSLQDQQEINGGILPILGLIGVAAIAQIIIDWDNFKNGLMGRPEVKIIQT